MLSTRTSQPDDLPDPRLTAVAPVFPVADVQRALRHYTALGFTTAPYGDGTEYGYAERDGVRLHLQRSSDSSGAGCAWLDVTDADALTEQWTRPGTRGRTVAPVDTPYGMREGGHLDPDGNLLRYGSRLTQLPRDPGSTVCEDLLGLLDHAGARCRDRMTGLTDEEWAWRPTDSAEVCIRWRLEHLRAMLTDARTTTWLGARASSTGPARASDTLATGAAGALRELETAWSQWRASLSTLDDGTLAAPIGSLAGRWGDGTRRSFALHVLDELVHHTAEAALLRDLYTGSPSVT